MAGRFVNTRVGYYVRTIVSVEVAIQSHTYFRLSYGQYQVPWRTF
jgi:hypothetical protein